MPRPAVVSFDDYPFRWNPIALALKPLFLGQIISYMAIHGLKHPSFQSTVNELPKSRRRPLPSINLFNSMKTSASLLSACALLMAAFPAGAQPIDIR
jgi:hypothetical protein